MLALLFWVSVFAFMSEGPQAVARGSSEHAGGRGGPANRATTSESGLPAEIETGIKGKPTPEDAEPISPWLAQ